jgi:hypothetical protein
MQRMRESQRKRLARRERRDPVNRIPWNLRVLLAVLSLSTGLLESPADAAHRREFRASEC